MMPTGFLTALASARPKDAPDIRLGAPDGVGLRTNGG